MLNAQTVQSRHADVFTLLQGDLEALATDCRPPGEAGPGSLVFVSEMAQLEAARPRGAAILVVQHDLAAALAPAEATFGCCFAVASVPRGMAVLLRHFDRKRERFAQWGERHPTAVVHPAATIGRGLPDRARLRDPPAHQHRQRRLRLRRRREPQAAEDPAPRQRVHRR